MKSEKLNTTIHGYQIAYEKFGTGDEVVLLIPGALGDKNFSLNSVQKLLNEFLFIGRDLKA